MEKGQKEPAGYDTAVSPCRFYDFMTQEFPESCNLSHRLIDSFALLIVPFFPAESENSFPCLDGRFIMPSDLMDLCQPVPGKLF